MYFVPSRHVFSFCFFLSLSCSFFCGSVLLFSLCVAFSILRCLRVDRSASLPHLAISDFCVSHVVRGYVRLTAEEFSVFHRLLLIIVLVQQHGARRFALRCDSAEVVVVLTEWFSRVQRANFEIESIDFWRCYFPEKDRRTDMYV